MGNVRIQLNHANIERILRGEEGNLRSHLEQLGQKVAAAAGPGNKVVTEVGRHRVRVAVITETFDAMQDEATDRSLTRAIDAAR